MSNIQLALPGLEPPAPVKPKRRGIQEQIAQLESHVFELELELTLLRIQLERDKDHG